MIGFGDKKTALTDKPVQSSVFKKTKLSYAGITQIRFKGLGLSSPLSAELIQHPLYLVGYSIVLPDKICNWHTDGIILLVINFIGLDV